MTINNVIKIDLAVLKCIAKIMYTDMYRYKMKHC